MIKFKNKNGITLIALVITIIILLILAGISISSLTNNGLFGKAQDADRESEIGRIKEEIKLGIYEKQLQNLGIISDVELVDILKKHGTVNYEDDGTIKGITTAKGYEIPMSEIYTGELTHQKTTLEYAECAKPAGSTIIETDATKGIVMVDSNQNEWVWVEVPKTTVFTTAQNATDYDNIKADLISYAADYRKGSATQTYDWTDEWCSKCGVADLATYTQMYNKMLSSVYTNGGFWISRYEIGDSTATASNTTRTSTSGIKGTAVSKPDQIPYNYVTCSQAQTLASGMSTDTNKTTSLLFGIQWDLTCKFIEEKTDLELADINSNSTSWGNCRNSSLTLNRGMYLAGSIWTPFDTDTENYVTNKQKLENMKVLLTTGASEETNKMNIYDFAGNEGEWTLEKTSGESSTCASRGGNYYNNGYSLPASGRQNLGAGSYSGGDHAFRSALY